MLMADEEAGFDFKRLARLSLQNWRWYAVSVAIALLATLLYINMTQPTYKREAQIMVLDGSQESSALGKLLEDITDMGFAFSDKANASNVIAAIQSPDVMAEVVRTLGLNVSYTKPGAFYDATLYGKTLPVTVEFIGLDEDETASMSIKLTGNGTVEMSDFVKDGHSLESEDLSCHLGRAVKTPIGTIKIKATDYYNKAETGLRINVRKDDLNAATGKFLHKLSVELADKQSTILNLPYTDVSPKRAEDILGAVINIYSDVWVKNRSRVSDATSKFIDERLAKIERELGDVDSDIANYKSKNLVPDVEMAYTLSMERADKNSARLLDLNTRLSVAKYIRNYIVDKANTNQLIPVDLGLDNDKVEEQIAEFNKLQLERNKLAANSGATNPLVRDMDKSLAQVRRSVIYSMNNMIMSLGTRISHLQNDEQKVNTNISANPTQAKFLLSVERQQKVKEALYLYLLQKREENDLARSFNARNTQVIKSPTGSNSPIAPRRNIAMIVGLIAGLALPCCIICLLDMADNTVRTTHDVESGTQLPLLGSIPHTGKERHGERLVKAPLRLATRKAGVPKLVVGIGNDDEPSEAFRLLRTNYLLPLRDRPSVGPAMLTSLEEGSGKTSVAINLGASLALLGKRVLLIDCDLRKAALSAFVGNPANGLCDYLNGTAASIGQLVRHYTQCPGLDILPVGTLPANPSELLSSELLGQMLAEACSLYDHILLDCQPLGKVADAALVAPLAWCVQDSRCVRLCLKLRSCAATNSKAASQSWLTTPHKTMLLSLKNSDGKSICL